MIVYHRHQNGKYDIVIKGDDMEENRKKEKNNTLKAKVQTNDTEKKKRIKNESISKDKQVEKEMNQKEITKKIPFTNSEVVFLVVITALVSMGITYVFTNAYYFKNKKTASKTNIVADENLQEFINSYQHIVDNYYEDVNKKELIDNAIKGMVSSLDDPYSTYLDKSTSSTFDANLAGTYQGVGLEIYNDEDSNVIVSRVFENSSAAKAGIQAGDIIKKIDDKDLSGKKTSEFSDYVKDSEKKKFTIVFSHDNVEKTVTVKKSIIIIQSVTSKVITQNEKKLGYIYVDIFSATTYNQFKEAVENLEKQNVDGMVIDVRDNTGGHLTVVSDMLSLFMDKKHIIYQIQDKGKTTKYYSSGKTTKKYPVVILQNESSASASELFSAAMKEEYGAKVVGTKSYGKGTVQELNTLTDGTQYKFTTKKWLTPKGNWVHEKGITPDYEISLNETYYETPTDENDQQLQKALSVLLEIVNAR